MLIEVSIKSLVLNENHDLLYFVVLQDELEP